MPEILWYFRKTDIHLIMFVIFTLICSVQSQGRNLCPGIHAHGIKLATKPDHSDPTNTRNWVAPISMARFPNKSSWAPCCPPWIKSGESYFEHACNALNASQTPSSPQRVEWSLGCHPYYFYVDAMTKLTEYMYLLCIYWKQTSMFGEKRENCSSINSTELTNVVFFLWELKRYCHSNGSGCSCSLIAFL